MMGDVDWIHLLQNGDRWWAVLSSAMNFQVPKNSFFYWFCIISASDGLNIRKKSKKAK
jgi:hypothetical protein